MQDDNFVIGYGLIPPSFFLGKTYTEISHYNNDLRISCQVQHLVVLRSIFFAPCIEKSDINQWQGQYSVHSDGAFCCRPDCRWYFKVVLN